MILFIIHPILISDDFWWLVRVTLVTAFGFLYKKKLGDGGVLQMMVLLKNECSFSGGNNQTLPAVLKNLALCTLRQ